MSGITIWTLESDNDKDAVKCLADKIVDYFKLDKVFIRAVGSSAKPKPAKGKKSYDEPFRRKVELYLKQDKCIIFVIDKDGMMSLLKRRQEPNSLINQVQRIVNDKTFSGRVHLALAVCELEAWLLIDCKGIFCYFADKKTKYKDCRNAISAKKNIMQMIGKYQKGNTELITEAVSGGDGAKEYLIEFSKEILKALNPKMNRKDIDNEKYHEAFSPDIAKYLEITKETLNRNASLKNLGELIKQCQKC